MFRKSMMALAIATVTAGPAWAAVSADEAKQLGTTLTPVGAEKAGNKDGTIPERTGGLTTPPAGFQKGSGKRPDPFANEKPRLVITVKDVAAQADKLTEGTKELLKRYPTMRVDVYPTHRVAYLPQHLAENTIKNATGAKSAEGGLGTENMLPGFPFPIPKTGAEAMWNHNLAYHGLGWNGKFDSWNVDSAGGATLATTGDVSYAWPMYDPKKAGSVKETDPYWYVRVVYVAPARRNGEGLMLRDSVNPLKQPRRAWQYLPGQRRVKLAPDIAYDTPNPGTSGAAVYDDSGVFNGALDRFDWKLVGKKEMYIPYSNYRLLYDPLKPADVTKPGHINPDYLRWELHRVWVVEATLKEGARHIYGKRVFYIDEDSWSIAVTDKYDMAGELWRVSEQHSINCYDVPMLYATVEVHSDLRSGRYLVLGLRSGQARFFEKIERSSADYTPAVLRALGVR
jgi:hypothetical protein